MTSRATALLQRAAVVAFAHDLVVAGLNRQMHAPDSRYVADALRDLIDALARVADLGVEMPLSLQLDDDRLHFDGEALEGPSLQARSLLRCCRERGIASLSFAQGLDADEANRFFDLLLLDDNRDALSRGHRDVVLHAFGIRHVRVTLRSVADPSDRSQAIDGAQRALHQYQDLAACMQENHRLAHRDMELAVDVTADAVERTIGMMDEPSLLLSLAAHDDVDRFTVGHSVRVALLALQVARALGASRSQLVHVGSAALLHDIGKSKVPQEILFKQGALTKEEWGYMRQHPRLGAQILLEQHQEVDPKSIGAAFCHHLGPSGRGYPDAAIPIVPSGISRLVRVCDVFEALTSVRPYKRALTPVEAYAVMFRNAGDFDPAWLQCFVKTLGLFPVGTRVHLDDDSAALVIGQTACPEHPEVRLLSGPGGTALDDGRPDTLVVGMAVSGQTRRIVGVNTHDRHVDVPEFDAVDPAAVAASHACLAPPAADK